MINPRGLRCGGLAIRNAPNQATTRPFRVRSYSSYISRSPLHIKSTPRSKTHSSIGPSIGQVRCISLWGLRSSSQPSDFSQIHGPNASSELGETLGADGKVLLRQQMAQSKEPVQAIQHTSDVPPSSSPPLDDALSSGTTMPEPLESTDNAFHHIPGIDLSGQPEESLVDLPERIGYLKEVCDLDFGWGPTSTTQWVLEHIHIGAGFSWTASTLLVALSIRLILFPTIIRSAKMSSKVQAAKPLMAAANANMREGYSTGNSLKMAEGRAAKIAIQQEYGIKMWHMFFPAFIQLPAGFASFRLLRNMAEVPVPALQTQDFLWLRDMTAVDPLYALPFIHAALIHFTIRTGGDTGQSNMPPALKSTLSYVFPGLSLVFMCFQPACIQVYFVCTSFLAFVTNRLLASDTVRMMVGLQPHHPINDPSISPFGGQNASSTGSADQKTSKVKTIAASISKPTSDVANLGPGGLRLYQRPRSAPNAKSSASKSPSSRPRSKSRPHTAHSADRSLIDRFVDAAKARKDAVMDDIYQVMGTSREERRQKAQRAETAERARRWKRERRE